MKTKNALRISNTHTTGNAPNASWIAAIQAESEAHLSVVTKLRKDDSRTKESKRMASHRDAETRLSRLLKRAKHEKKQVVTRYINQRRELDKMYELRGSTDVALLANYAQLLVNKTPSEIMRLARHGDVNAIRATLLLPVMRYDEKFSPLKEPLLEELEKAVIGSDVWESYTENREQMNTLHRLEEGLTETAKVFAGERQDIERHIVADDVLGAEPPAFESTGTVESTQAAVKHGNDNTTQQSSTSAQGAA